MNLICEYCSKPFETKRKRRCCDRSCSAKLSMAAKGKAAWLDEETLELERLAGTMPLVDVVKRMQSWQRRKDLPVRTAISIQVKLKREGLQRKCTVDNITRWELSRELGITYDRVEHWTQRHGVPYRKIARNQTAVKIADVRSLAYQKPYLFAGIERDRLLWLLDGDEDQADECLSFELRGIPKPVRCVETGEIFPSIKAAARASYVHPACLRGAIVRGGKSAGKRWELIA